MPHDGHDRAGKGEHQSHRNAQIEIHCFSFCSGKENIQRKRAQQNGDTQGFGPLPPAIQCDVGGLGVSECTSPTSSDSGRGFVNRLTITVIDKVGAEGKDRAPEVLRHVAGIVMHHRDPSAVNARVRLDRQRQSVMQHRRRGAR